MIIVLLGLHMLHSDGWQAYAQHRVSGVTRLEATWTVPDNPRSPSGTIFVFPALQNVHDTSQGKAEIMQPVLQWGSSAAGGGDWWGVSSWYISTEREIHTSELVRVYPNDTIVGTMEHVGNTTWRVEASVGSKSTWIEVDGVPHQTYAFVSLETYGAKACDNLPTSPIRVSVAGNWTAVNPRYANCAERVACDVGGCTIRFQGYL